MDSLAILNVLELLSEDLNNELFDNLKEIVESHLNSSKLVDITIPKKMYNFIIKSNINLKNIIEVRKDNVNAIHITILIKIGLLTFSFKELDGEYQVKINISNTKTNTNTRVILDKFVDFYRIEMIDSIKEGGIYIDYKYDVFYYDFDYNLIPKSLYFNNEIIKHYMDEFNLSLDEALICIKDFKKFAKFISDKEAIGMMEYYDDEMYKEQKYEFRSPFTIDNFELFMTKEIIRDSQDDIENLDSSVVQDSYNFSREKINAIIDPLKKQIGEDGEIVISSNIYNNFNFYLFDFVSTLYTNGLIIKKLNDIYTLYYVNIAENNLVAIPQELSKEDIQTLYNKCSENEKVLGLKEFLGLNKSR